MGYNINIKYGKQSFFNAPNNRIFFGNTSETNNDWRRRCIRPCIWEPAGYPPFFHVSYSFIPKQLEITVCKKTACRYYRYIPMGTYNYTVLLPPFAQTMTMDNIIRVSVISPSNICRYRYIMCKIYRGEYTKSVAYILYIEFLYYFYYYYCYNRLINGRSRLRDRLRYKCRYTGRNTWIYNIMYMSPLQSFVLDVLEFHAHTQTYVY